MNDIANAIGLQERNGDLSDLAIRINEVHDRAVSAATIAINHAIEAGKLLIEAKAACQHGSWGDWLSTNFRGSQRTAQGYMRVATGFDTLPKAQRVADLPYREVLKLLSDRESDDPNKLTKANRELIPSAGHRLIFESTKEAKDDCFDRLVIEPQNHPDYFFVTVIRDYPEGGAFVQGTRRGLIKTQLANLVRDYGAEGIVKFGKRTEVKVNETWKYNHLLYDSYEHYLREGLGIRN